MKTRMMAVAALALAAACGGSGAAPQDGPAPREQGGAPPAGITGGGVPNVFALIGAREQLGLTGAQVTELDSINRIWSVRNDSLQRQMRGPGGRTELAVVRPVLERIAENNQSASQAVEAVLTPEQRRIACTLPIAESRRPQMTGIPGAGRPARRGMGPRGRGDTIPGMRARRGWHWCTAAAPADSAG